jgi:hypothetical protein
MAIIYVKSGSTGNGSAWNNAYGSLASAITAKLCKKINNVLGLISGFTLATAGMLLVNSNPASASQLWTWYFYGRIQGNIYASGSGSFTTDDGDSNGVYLITGITGSVSDGGFARNITSLDYSGQYKLQSSHPQTLSFSFFTQIGCYCTHSVFWDPNAGTLNEQYVFYNGNPYYQGTRVAFYAINVSPPPPPPPPISVPEPSNLIGLITLSGLMLGNAVKKARKSG